MTNINDDQKAFYQQVYDKTRKEIEDISNQIEEELAQVKERITKLNNQKQAIRKMYEGACACLGIESEFESLDEGEEGFEEEEEE
ncbi:MAG TPA: hypothetical protein PLV45_09280 [bacterium]|nr:hypothetical protein [bacterium]